MYETSLLGADILTASNTVDNRSYSPVLYSCMNVACMYHVNFFFSIFDPAIIFSYVRVSFPPLLQYSL